MRFFLVFMIAVLIGTSLRASKVTVSLFALEIGTSPATVGILGALYALFPLALALHAGRFVDARGVTRPCVLGTLVMIASAVAPLVAPNLGGLAVSAALLGLGHIYAHVALHAWVGASASGNERTKRFSQYSLAVSTAAFLGPVIAGFMIDAFGYPSGFAVVVVCSVAAAICALTLRSKSSPHATKATQDEAPKRALDLLSDPMLRRTLLLSGAALTGTELFSFFFPIYGRSIDLSASAIGVILGAYAVAAFVVRTVLHRITTRVREITLISGSLLVAAAVFMVMPAIPHAGLLALASFVLGLGLGCAQPLTTVLTYNQAPPGRAGEALGLRLTVNKASQIAVPVLFGAIGTAAGVAPVFWIAAAFLGSSGLLSITRPGLPRTVPPPA
jgi:predicted MFS family arabinose efflux permease